MAENTKEEQPIGAPVTANDGDLLLYTLGGADAASFDIDKKTGQIKTKAKLDFETKATYVVVVTATDPSGATDSIMVTINVTDVNDGAAITGDGSITYAENGTDPVATFTAVDADGDAIVWSLAEKDDYKLFTITGGVLAFKKSPDYEMPNSVVTGGTPAERNVYKVTIQATGGTHDVVVNVTNVDEAGKVTFSGEGRFQPQVGRGLSASLNDPEGNTDARGSGRGVRMERRGRTLRAPRPPSRSPVADDEGMWLRASVTYADSFGSGKTASAVTGNLVEARTVANAAPSFRGQDDDNNGDTPVDGIQINRNVNENSAEGASIGDPVSASDADNDVLVYELSGTVTMADGSTTRMATDLFSIDTGTGQLKVKAELDFEGPATANPTDDRYAVTVKATDPSGASASETVTIHVQNVNEGPKFDRDTTADGRQAPRTTLWVTENDGDTTTTADDDNTLRIAKADPDGWWQ